MTRVFFKILCKFVFVVSLALNAFAQTSETQIESQKSSESKTSESFTSPKYLEEADLGSDDFSRDNQISSDKQLVLDLKDCVQMALLNNREVRATEYDIEAAKWKHNEAKAGFKPVFDYQIDMGPAPLNVDNALGDLFSGDVTLATRFRVEVGMPVFTFGKLGVAQDLALTGVAAEQQKRLQKQNDVVVKVKKLYSGILFARDLKALLQEADQHLGDEISNKENSDKPSDPVQQTKLKLYRLEVMKRLYEVEERELLAVEGFRILLGISKAYKFELADKHLNPIKNDLKNFESYMELSRKNNPEQKLLAMGVYAKGREYELEKRKLTPDIGIGGFIEYGFSSDAISGITNTDDYSNPFNFTRGAFGVRLKGKLDIHGQRAKIKNLQAQYYSATLKKNIAKEGLELALQTDYEQLNQANKELQDSEKGRQLARQLVFLTKSNLDIGVGGGDDYADALKQYLLMRGRYLETVFNYNSKLAEFEAKLENASEVLETR